KCAQCGNNYDESFEVTKGGRTLTFDSFECASAALAPVCPHCGCRIIGHGVQHGDTIYCCVHCAKHEGVQGLVDRDCLPPVQRLTLRRPQHAAVSKDGPFNASPGAPRR